jgi:acyl dehydratase
MALNPQAVGKTTAELKHEYRWQDQVLYALGIGAKRVDELDFLFEGKGPKVFPTYAVIPTFAANGALFDVIAGNLLGVVHGGQSIKLHKPFGSSGKLTTVGKVAGIYDLKRMAQANITTETRDEKGDLVCETEWVILYRMDGGFGGEGPPKRNLHNPPDRPADWKKEEATTTEQALLYRLNGDLNPLHADPEIGKMAGFGQPILHGLCTYGLVGRAIMEHACGRDPARFRSFAGSFKKPVWPGETLITEGWQDGDEVTVRTTVSARPGEPVFQGTAEVSR